MIVTQKSVARFARSSRLRRVKADLLSRKVETSGRRRKLYKLTRKGERALGNWLATPPDGVFEMRDIAVLQLFFSEFMNKEDLVRLANSRAKLYRERLAIYAQIEKTNVGRMDRNRRMAPLFPGIKMANACLGFWEDIAKNPPPP
jgi:PadR family transcriptional regulator, regulatory protein AphA